MRKRLIIIGCVVVIALITLAIVLGNNEQSLTKKPSTGQETTEQEPEGEVPFDVIDPEKDKNTDKDKVNNQKTDKNEENKKEDNQNKEDLSNKPIELPFVPAD